MRNVEWKKSVPVHAEILQGQLDMLFHRTDTQSQQMGDLVIGERAKAAHLEHLPALGRHFFDGFENAEPRFLEFGQVLRPLGRGLLGKDGGTGHQQVPLGTKDIHCTVPRQDEQIVFEGQALIQPVPVQPHLHKDHLGKVFRQGIVLDEGLNEPMDLGIIPEEDGVEGTAISLLDESDQLTVR